MFVTVVHPDAKGRHNAMNVWVDKITTGGFRVCMREFANFDGIHKNLKVVSNKAVTRFAAESTFFFFAFAVSTDPGGGGGLPYLT